MKKIVLILLIAVISALPAFANIKDADFPKEAVVAIDEILNATANGAKPSEEQVNFLIGFMHAQDYPSGTFLSLNEREYGNGTYYQAKVDFNLKDYIDYSLDPKVPTEILYPASIRRGYWREDSKILQDASAIKALKLPPEQMFYTSGIENEEITPDLTSGCYYNYELKRLVVVTKDPVTGSTAVISAAVQVAPSSIGLKGLVLGNDSDLNYIYTDVTGSNLSMVGWAKTQIYASANISVWIEKNGELYANSLNWLKAGWSGMNVVEAENITSGVERGNKSLNSFLSSKNRPSQKEIEDYHISLKNKNDQELEESLQAQANKLLELANSGEKLSDDYMKALRDGNYAKSLSKEHKIAELLKLYIKEKLN